MCTAPTELHQTMIVTEIHNMEVSLGRHFVIAFVEPCTTSHASMRIKHFDRRLNGAAQVHFVGKSHRGQITYPHIHSHQNPTFTSLQRCRLWPCTAYTASNLSRASCFASCIFMRVVRIFAQCCKRPAGLVGLCSVRRPEDEATTPRAQQQQQRHRMRQVSIRAVKETPQEEGKDASPPRIASMHRRAESGSQAANLAEHLIQAPLEPRGVVANLFDKLRVCISLARVAYSHLGTGTTLV